ncbi:hypothetical protein [Dactylosporangium matsuzakiense]|uniref:Uncharacterized protein n=1 Tax=Dactylosporangium matsuzakiense TaxID=53360 RepID=A0A9W6NMA7_9ACTN|nr:hypothetical protein [Dactylosporangium matsuzakiense]GLL02830.1 hypothetical protein GCM10017581_045720 [Dactylosporangium matsuzakiense]
MSRAVRLVIALYPRHVRDQYGPEIADLLSRSRRPLRDLADVALCALAERMQALTYARLRPHVNATTGLIAAPVAFAGAYLLFYTLCAWIFAVVAAVAGASVTSESAGTVPAAAALPVAGGAIWLAGHARPPFTSALAPAGLAIGVLPVMLLVTDIGRWPMTAAVGAWGLTTGTVSTVAVALVRRGHRRRAVLAMAFGGLLACELAIAVYSLSVFDSLSVAIAAYPVTSLGINPGLIGDPTNRVADAMTILPALLTSCTAYALGLATTTRAGRPTTVPTQRGVA